MFDFSRNVELTDAQKSIIEQGKACASGDPDACSACPYRGHPAERFEDSGCAQMLRDLGQVVGALMQEVRA